MMREMCGVQLYDGKRATGFMLIFSLNKRMDQLATASSIRWFGHVLRRGVFMC